MINVGDVVAFNADGQFDASRWKLDAGALVTVVDIRQSVYAKGLVYDIVTKEGIKMHGFGIVWLTEVEEDF